MEEVELPEGFSQYLMLYDGKESVVASYKMIEGYEVMGWMVAKGTLPCSDGCYRIDRYDSQHTVFFNEWAYGKLVVLDYNTGEVISISLDVLLEDNEEIEDFLQDVCHFRLSGISWMPFSGDVVFMGLVTTGRIHGHPEGGAFLTVTFLQCFIFDKPFYDDTKGFSDPVRRIEPVTRTCGGVQEFFRRVSLCAFMRLLPGRLYKGVQCI